MKCDVCVALGIDEERPLALTASSNHKATVKGKFYDLSGMSICVQHYNQIGEDDDIDKAIYAFQKARKQAAK